MNVLNCFLVGFFSIWLRWECTAVSLPVVPMPRDSTASRNKLKHCARSSVMLGPGIRLSAYWLLTDFYVKKNYFTWFAGQRTLSTQSLAFHSLSPPMGGCCNGWHHWQCDRATSFFPPMQPFFRSRWVACALWQSLKNGRCVEHEGASGLPHVTFWCGQDFSPQICHNIRLSIFFHKLSKSWSARRSLTRSLYRRVFFFTVFCPFLAWRKAATPLWSL